MEITREGNNKERNGLEQEDTTEKSRELICTVERNGERNDIREKTIVSRREVNNMSTRLASRGHEQRPREKWKELTEKTIQSEADENWCRRSRRQTSTRTKKYSKVQVRPNKLCLLYNNVAGNTKKEWEALEEVVKIRAADVICLTETHWREGYREKKIPGYKSFIRNRGQDEKKGGRVAIMVRDDIKSYERELKQSDVVAVTIKTSGGYLLIDWVGV